MILASTPTHVVANTISATYYVAGAIAGMTVGLAGVALNVLLALARKTLAARTSMDATADKPKMNTPAHRPDRTEGANAVVPAPSTSQQSSDASHTVDEVGNEGRTSTAASPASPTTQAQVSRPHNYPYRSDKNSPAVAALTPRYGGTPQFEEARHQQQYRQQHVEKHPHYQHQAVREGVFKATSR